MNETIHIGADGEREYPCRCGQTHRGMYAAYDWGHHNCFHDSPLFALGDDDPGHFICGGCGKSFFEHDRYWAGHESPPCEYRKCMAKREPQS